VIAEQRGLLPALWLRRWQRQPPRNAARTSTRAMPAMPCSHARLLHSLFKLHSEALHAHILLHGREGQVGRGRQPNQEAGDTSSTWQVGSGISGFEHTIHCLWGTLLPLIQLSKATGTHLERGAVGIDGCIHARRDCS